ncbi:BT1926 family outer membrane beta-barrel protein [Lutibacter flavus]|uniref:Outer membrane protein W n=1 Tax=Lutibacter flavus TaxID=691689 RepID=A0A238WWE4_9FLAO|nr:BT1926 family outer membrane beta-barrel protein [Lutibacter flavus]SNR50955.1 Outer membrane protein W [Lutibacter flavus]
MKKYLILCFILVITLTSVNAQDKDSEHVCATDSCCVEASKFAPQKGDFTAAMVLGRGAYLNSGLTVPYSNGTVSGVAAYDNGVDTNSNSITNMVGAEGRYFVSNKFAVSFSGGAIIRNTPSQLGIPAVRDVNGVILIPAYSSVVADERVDVNVSVGGQWIFKTKNERLFPYLGFALPFDYARRSLYDPTVIVDDNTYTQTITDLGARHVDITAFGVQAVAGVDYYIAKDLFFGFDIKPVSYTYAVNMKTPGPGLMNLEAETDTVSFFAQFSAKIGFKF